MLLSQPSFADNCADGAGIVGKSETWPGVPQPHQARLDYMLNCQGCHGPEGRGSPDVPALRNFSGYFLHVPEGRDFLVQVPGVANAALAPEALAQLLN